MGTLRNLVVGSSRAAAVLLGVTPFAAALLGCEPVAPPPGPGRDPAAGESAAGTATATAVASATPTTPVLAGAPVTATPAESGAPVPSGSVAPGGAAPSGAAAPSGSVAPGGPAPSASVFVADPSITATTTTVTTSAGPMVFHAVHHGTMYVELGGKVLWLDPWSQGKLDSAPKGDFILVTDIHQDHLDPKAVAQVKKQGAVVMGPKAVADQLPGTTVIANGEKKTLGTTDGGPIEVEATPMYNLTRGPEAGKLFHDKGRGNGYVLTYGGKRVYISGDTECIPEMKALKDIELAFVAMNLPYTMPPEEAAGCIAAFKPKTVVPFHHRGSDLGVLEAKLAGSGVKVEKLRFY